MSEWITTSEAVRLSGYNAEYIRRLIRTERIEARKFATVWQISRASLLAYIDETEQSVDKRRGPQPKLKHER